MIQQNAADGKILRQRQDDGTYLYAKSVTRPDNSLAWEEVDEQEYANYLAEQEREAKEDEGQEV